MLSSCVLLSIINKCILPVDILDLGGHTNERCIGSTRMTCMEICEQEMKPLPYFYHRCTQTVPLSHHLMDICEAKKKISDFIRTNQMNGIRLSYPSLLTNFCSPQPSPSRTKQSVTCKP